MRRSAFSAAAVLGALVASIALSGAAPPSEPAPQTFTLRDARRVLPAAKPARPVPSRRLGIDLQAVPQVVLAAPDRQALLAEDEAQQGLRKALRFGVGRSLTLGAADGHWYDLRGGARLWVAEVSSAEALGLRLHFSRVRLPARAELAVYSPSGSEARRVIATYGATGQRREFWTRTFPGDRVRIEYLVPAGVESQAGQGVPFTVDRLQHVYRDPVAETSQAVAKAAGRCNNDVSCHPEWEDVARAVGGIGVINRDSLFCSGTLLNTQRQDFTPYYLTASHCLYSDEAARDAEVYWFYQTPGCGATAPSLTNVPSSLGARLLGTHPDTDFTLLLVEGALPPGVSWAGWTTEPAPEGASVTGIHHPSGDYKRISFAVRPTERCRNPNLVRVHWTNGPIEPGSSGSGIFRNDTQQLFGQLFLGISECANLGWSCYGDFSLTYPRIRSFMQEGPDDLSEPNDTCARPRPARTGTLRELTVKLHDTDWYRINVPRGRTLTVTLSFRHSDGDVDARLYSRCGPTPLAISEGAEDTEVLTFTNRGRHPAPVSWQVYLASDTRAGYDMTVSIR